MKTITKTIMVLSLIAALYLISWGATVGIIKLITLCFGLKFSLIRATGLWLVIYLIRLALNKKKSD